MSTPAFKKWNPTITEEEILNYILTWQNKGFNIVQGKPPAIDGWTIEFNPSVWISIRPSNVGSTRMWSIGVAPLGRIRGTFGSLEEIDTCVNALWSNLGVTSPVSTQQINLFKGQPIQNSARLVSILNGEAIDSIYDPYFNDEACQRLALLKGLGAVFNRHIKILTSIKKPSSQLVVDELCKELSASIEVKQATKDHHRLIFLSTGRCLSLDLSFNKFDSSGSVVQIDKPNEKRSAFFDPEWQKATLLFKGTN